MRGDECARSVQVVLTSSANIETNESRWRCDWRNVLQHMQYAFQRCRSRYVSSTSRVTHAAGTRETRATHPFNVTYVHGYEVLLIGGVANRRYCDALDILHL